VLEKKKTIEVENKSMAYVEEGSGDPIVFLHGNPTSSYLWRNVMPHLLGRGRLIAPDLIGMGDSDKLNDSGPGSYGFFEHRHYLESFLEVVGVRENVTLVLHDWGSALGFHWAHRNPDAIRGIAYMEAITRPMAWDDFNQDARPVFQGFRSSSGESMVLEKNIFIEKVLPGSIIRTLSEEEMAEYRRPFLNAGEDRRPTLSWPREIPLDGEPSAVAEIVEAYGQWMETVEFPKLFINAEPGAILIGPQREFCRTWPNTRELTVKGIHFIQEDSPDEIGQGIAAWMDGW
tara:strand:- start:3070 stop:3933 length:864 start_codon:yes stop_codon:yes gene_type:complete